MTRLRDYQEAFKYIKSAAEDYVPQSDFDLVDKALNYAAAIDEIEEDLGVDLAFSINVCKQVNSQKYVYVKESCGIFKLNLYDPLDFEVINNRLYSNARGVWLSLKMEEYGKEWALRRKDLE